MSDITFFPSTPNKAQQGFSKGSARDDCRLPRIKQGLSRIARVFLLIRVETKRKEGKEFPFFSYTKVVRRTLAILDGLESTPQNCKATLAEPLLQPLLGRA
jgi:hypothetical protein